MDTNSLFSLSRIVMVMKCDIIGNKKAYLLGTLGMYAAFAFIMLATMQSWSGKTLVFSMADEETAFSMFCNRMFGMFVLVTLVVGLVRASCIMENMVTKEKRIAYLMLPASMVEKFLARFLLVTVGFAVTVVVAALLAEVTRYLLLPLFHVPDVFHRSVLLHWVTNLTKYDGGNVFLTEIESWLGRWCGWASLIWIHSLYVLGGSLWYKKPFLKTWGVLFLIFILIILLLGGIGRWMGRENLQAWMEWLSPRLQWVTLEHVTALGITIFHLFTLFNWWLSYRLFVRSQVIKPKFRLL
ncbi:hypothetical protein [Phocaeicola sp.]|uniref:hypothetical protein n=1 Tax=Phocaeicola sp. TaxID=2773926 RepID=UPI0023BE0232|nr:hypothetical protein [Phocaeicola sp.]MDE5678087.1 hypothetical protein [Phocaeicola sp.]